MARTGSGQHFPNWAWQAFQRLPASMKAIVLLIGLAVLVYFTLTAPQTQQKQPDQTQQPDPTDTQPADPGKVTPTATGKYSFAFWNVENLFDDKVDQRNATDRPYDEGFANNIEIQRLKYQRIAEAVLALSGGRGPDILVCVEVESIRAGEILRKELNARLPDDSHYHWLAMKNLDAGRHIAPCVISRVPVQHARTQLHGRNLRILEAAVGTPDQPLHIIASHWTSRRQQPNSTSNGESGRENYARTIRQVVSQRLRQKPEADLLLCGDFNTPPDDPLLTNTLGCVADPRDLRATAPGTPQFLNLLASRTPAQYGTLWNSGKPLIYDQICVSPGLLDTQGWSCAPDSVAVPSQGLLRPGSSRRQPWRFGDPDSQIPLNQRGYSDHFPVTVSLQLHAKTRPIMPE